MMASLKKDSAFLVHSKKRKSTSPGQPNKVKKLTQSMADNCELNKISSIAGVSTNSAVQGNGVLETSKKTNKRKHKQGRKKNLAHSQSAITNKSENERPKIRISPKSHKTETNTTSSKISSKKIEPVIEDEEEFNTNEVNPLLEATNLFQWLIHPLSINAFFTEHWEKTPLHIKQRKPKYFKKLISTPMIDDVLRRFNVLYTKNLDITSYSDGKRETHNPQGRALPSVVWDYYSNGCSIRMLNPQTFIPQIHTMNAALQEYFGCFVGANFYLTPPGSQGFAPHYDDIEAFILQVEGKKRWRLYKPRTENEYLARFSSKNFEQNEIGQPIFDDVVEAGDILYFPRGTIHQGETLDDSHSLHLTLSVYQKNSWGDLLEKLLPQALNTAITQNSQLREGLPLDYLKNMGLAHATQNNEFRTKFVETTKNLLHKVIDSIDVDKAVDQMAKGHIHDVLPPILVPVEMECSVLQDGEKMVEGGKVENRVEIEPDTRIRLTRAHCARLIEEDNTYKLYYSTENSREYHEYDIQFLEVDEAMVPAMKKIISIYPEFVRVDDLPIEGEDNRVQVARDLWEKCIVLTEVPLPIIE